MFEIVLTWFRNHEVWVVLCNDEQVGMWDRKEGAMDYVTANER